MGPDPFRLEPRPGCEGPCLSPEHVTDVPAATTADPFIFAAPDGLHLFFEVWDTDRHRGVIAHAYGAELGEWSYDRVVLVEPWHLSYPHVFAWGGEIWMIPESRQAERVNLYRSTKFPHGWEFERVLIEGNFADSTLLCQPDGCYLFSQRA